MMNRASLAVLIGAMLFAAGTAAQAGAQTGGSSALLLPDGTTLNAELGAALDSKKARAGDAVVAHITEPVKADGKIVIPKGAKLMGHVTQSSAKAKGDSESALAIQFDKAILKDGEEIVLSVRIQAIAAEPRSSALGSPDLNPVAGTGSAAAAGSPMRTTRAPVVGDTRTTEAANNGANNTAANAGGSVNAADGSSGNAGGLNATGQLSANSRGVIGIDGVRLASDAATDGSLITSAGKSVHLDSGTRLLLQSRTEAPAPPPK